MQFRSKKVGGRTNLDFYDEQGRKLGKISAHNDFDPDDTHNHTQWYVVNSTGQYQNVFQGH